MFVTLTATDWDGIPGFWHLGRFYPQISGGDGTEGTPPADGGSTEGESSDGTGGSSDGGQQQEKTLTQSEVNAIVARETDKARRGLLNPKELGFESGKEMKEFIDQAKALVEDQKSDTEKALVEAKKAGRDEAIAEILPSTHERIMRAEFLMAAMQHDVKLPNDAFVLAKTLKQWEDVSMDDDGVVTGLDKPFFEALKKDKPYLFGEPSGAGPAPSDIGAGAQEGAGGTPPGPVDPGRAAQLRKSYPILDRMAEAMGVGVHTQPPQEGQS
jgi:hypothetical protein